MAKTAANGSARGRTPHASVSRRAISARGVRLRIAVLGRSRDRRIAVAPDAVYVTATPSRSVSDTTSIAAPIASVAFGACAVTIAFISCG